MSDGMIERVTRSVFYSLNASGPMCTNSKNGQQVRLASGADLSPENWQAQNERCEEVARAAIAAMRAPTDDFVHIFIRPHRIKDKAEFNERKACFIIQWQAMIDAALSNVEPNTES